MALFFHDPSPQDVNQGGIGDCWLVSAMACLAEFPQAVQNVFVSRRYNPNGKYTIRLYDGRYDEWVTISIDDFIPVKKSTGRPIFLNPKGHAMWALLLEKAFAKFCSGYSNLDGGIQAWAFQALTGDVAFALHKKGSGSWERLDLSYHPPNRKGACSRLCTKIYYWFFWCCKPYRTENPRDHYGFRSHGKEKYDDEKIWKLLTIYDKRKALISCAKSNKGESKSKTGIVAGHAYSVLHCEQVGKYRMIRMRNPWGSFEWNGAWSDGDSMWKKHKDVAKKLHYDAKSADSDDGCFWIEFNDWKRLFDGIDICDRSSNRDLALDVNEEEGLKGVCCGCVKGCGSYWFLCNGCRKLYCSHKTEDETATTSSCCC